MLGEQLAGPPDQPGGGLRPGHRDDVHEHQQFFAAQLAGGTRLVDELRIEQFGGQVIGRMTDPPVDELGEQLTVGDGPSGLSVI